MPGEDFQKRMNQQGEEYIAMLRGVVHDLWAKMCEEDGISPPATFVVFGDDNKYQPFYNNALTQLWEAEAAYRAGGYVGLSMAQPTQLQTFREKRKGGVRSGANRNSEVGE